MKNTYNVLIEKDEAGWLVSEVVELPGCHTQAKNLDELMKRTKHAISAYLQAKGKNRIEERFIGIQQLEV